MPEIYEEIVPFPLMKLVLGLFIALTIVFLVVFVYQVLVGPVGTKPGPDWLYIIMFLLFAGFTVLIRSFNKLAVIITTQSITVGFGIFKRVISWDDIHGCYLDDASAFGGYGGWGIRMGKVKGKWRLVYNVIGCPTVVLELDKGRFKEFVFSTKNPEMVLEVTRQQISK